MCLIQMTLLEYSGIGIIKQLAPKEMPYHIVTRISHTAAKNKIKARIFTSSGVPGNAAIAPATKSNESPGRKGVTTKPVSQKTIMNNIT